MMTFLEQLDAWLVPGPAGSTLTWGDLLRVLMLTYVLGQLVSWVYVWTHRGLTYSRGFVQSLIYVPLVVAIVMIVIEDSLARAFGLVGALALIRFRTAVRDTRDIAFLFLALSAGIAVGARQYFVACVGTVFINLVAAMISWTSLGGRVGSDAFLRLLLTGDAARGAALQAVLSKYCHSISLISARDAGAEGRFEVSYQIRLLGKDLFTPLVEDLKNLAGVENVDMSSQDTSVEP